jgi:hypothetical protein
MDTKAFSEAVESLKRSTAELEAEINEKSGELCVHRLIAKALNGLRNDWRQGDPGKYGQHWFFVKRYALLPDTRHGHIATLERCERFWVREVISNLEAATQGVPMSRPHGGQLERQAPVPLGGFDEAKTEPCRDANCGAPCPVIGCYEQTEDGPDGDTWEIHLYALCLACPTLHPIAKRADEYRLSHLLSWPAS